MGLQIELGGVLNKRGYDMITRRSRDKWGLKCGPKYITNVASVLE